MALTSASLAMQRGGGEDTRADCGGGGKRDSYVCSPRAAESVREMTSEGLGEIGKCGVPITR